MDIEHWTGTVAFHSSFVFLLLVHFPSPSLWLYFLAGFLSLLLALSHCTLGLKWVPAFFSFPSLSSQLFSFPPSFLKLSKCLLLYRLLRIPSLSLNSDHTYRAKHVMCYWMLCFFFWSLNMEELNHALFLFAYMVFWDPQLARLSCLMSLSLQSPFSTSPLKILQGSEST